MTHAPLRSFKAHLVGALLLVAGLSTFLLYEPGPGRATPLKLAVTSAAR